MTTLEFKTQQLEVQFAKKQDYSSLFTLYTGRKEESFYLARKPHISEDVTQSMLENWSTPTSWKTNARTALIITLKDSKTPFGLLILISKGNQLEFHFGLSNDYSGLGLATELVTGLIRFTQTEKHFEALATYTDKEHKASQKVLEKAGFTRLSISKAKFLNPNQHNKPIDCINYYFNRKK